MDRLQPPGLRRDRGGPLRRQVETSTLFDGPDLARHLLAAFSAMAAGEQPPDGPRTESPCDAMTMAGPVLARCRPDQAGGTTKKAPPEEGSDPEFGGAQPKEQVICPALEPPSTVIFALVLLVLVWSKQRRPLTSFPQETS